MTDQHHLNALLRSADLVPELADPPAGSWSSHAALLEIERRSATVQTQQTQTPSDERPRGSGRRGVFAAAAAFAIVLIVVGIAALLLAGGTESVPPATEVTTTSEETTTEASDAQQRVETFRAYWNAAASSNPDGALSQLTLSDPDSDIPLVDETGLPAMDIGLPAMERGVVEFLAAIGWAYSLTDQCVEETLAPAVVLRTCSAVVQSPIHDLLDANSEQVGLIFIDSNVAVEARVAPADSVQRAYVDWANTNDIDRFRAICDPSLFDFEIGQPYGDRFVFTGECGTYLASITDQVAASLTAADEPTSFKR